MSANTTNVILSLSKDLGAAEWRSFDSAQDVMEPGTPFMNDPRWIGRS
jgi:hypothetical protein